MIKIQYILEIFIFSIIMVVFGFLISYITDILLNRKIIWFPKHSYEMASGTFLTSSVVFIIFSKKYIKYKCS
jgi:membrane protein implicated in regulation of membrane protease activity